MNEILSRQQRYQRLKSLSNLARERYLLNGGDPHKSASGSVYLTEEEQQEFLAIARELSTKATN